MSELKKTFRNIQRKDFYVKYFRIVNSLLPLPLTDGEIKVLSSFMLLRNGEFIYDRFGGATRGKVLQILLNEFGYKMSRSALNNHVVQLVNKGILYREEDRVIRLNKQVEKGIQGNNIELSFKFEIND